MAATLPENMRGVMFVEKGKAVLQDEPVPQPVAGRLLCESVFTGLTNGTERNTLTGGNYGGSWPDRCGYQNVGRVLQVGDGIEGWAEGELLFSGDFCQHVGYFNADPNGLVVRVPEGVAPKHAALFGVGGVATHDVRRADVKLGEKVLVVGAGPIGQFTAQMARAAGANVTIVDLNEERLEVARECGIPRTIQIEADRTWDGEVKQAGPFDAIFEDSGAPVLDKIIGLEGWGQGLLKMRGKVVMIAGRHEVTYGFNAGQGQELTVLHAGHFAREDLEILAWLVAQGTVKVAPILQDVVKIDDAVAIYDRLRDDPAGLFGTVFDWQ